MKKEWYVEVVCFWCAVGCIHIIMTIWRKTSALNRQVITFFIVVSNRFFLLSFSETTHTHTTKISLLSGKFKILSNSVYPLMTTQTNAHNTHRQKMLQNYTIRGLSQFRLNERRRKLHCSFNVQVELTIWLGLYDVR